MTVSTTVVPELDITYFFTPNIAAELVLGVTRHHINGAATLAGTDVGRVWLLPPTLMLQYHFTNFGNFKPYVGAGVNYTFFFSEKAAGGTITQFSVEDSFGFALQAGFDLMLDRHWGLNFDVKKLYLRPDVSFNNGALTGKVAISNRGWWRCTADPGPTDVLTMVSSAPCRVAHTALRPGARSVVPPHIVSTIFPKCWLAFIIANASATLSSGKVLSIGSVSLPASTAGQRSARMTRVTSFNSSWRAGAVGDADIVEPLQRMQVEIDLAFLAAEPADIDDAPEQSGRFKALVHGRARHHVDDQVDALVAGRLSSLAPARSDRWCRSRDRSRIP